PWLLPNARTPRYQKPVLQSYRLSPYLRETGRWPLRGEGQWRVGIRSSRQNLEAVGTGPWISRLCSLQIRWATRSALLCRCPARNLGFAAEPGDHWCRRPLRARHERPCRRAAEQRDEVAPRYHSITSSARASNVAGTSMPSAFAVLRLMISSISVRWFSEAFTCCWLTAEERKTQEGIRRGLFFWNLISGSGRIKFVRPPSRREPRSTQ